MLSRISQHPFPVEAHFDYSLVLTYAYPIEAIQPLIPDCLELDTFQDKWAFVAVAMVQTRELRPKGFPKFIGNHFFLVGYRIFVRYQSQSGRRLRGLYILRSETDKIRMQLLGNAFTNYNYSRIKVSTEFKPNESFHVHSPTTGLNLSANIQQRESIPLPHGSPFGSWREARMFAGPMPFTFSVSDKEVVIVEGKRSQWQPRPVEVIDAEIPYLKQLVADTPLLANAFVTEDISYEWSSGRHEPHT